MSGASTVLRYIKGKDFEKITKVVEALPFKIEIKNHIIEKGVHWLTFTLDDVHYNFKNIDLDKVKNAS